MSREYYEIKADDVGKSWFVGYDNFKYRPQLGLFLKIDIGKRLYRVKGVWQIENRQQFVERRRKDYSNNERIWLIKTVYEWAIDSTEGFSDPWGAGQQSVGVDVAYLLGAIAKGEWTDLRKVDSLWLMLTDKEIGLPRDHPVWWFVREISEKD